MNPDDRHDDGLADPERVALDALLARPHVWDELPAGLEDVVVTAIATEAGRAEARRAHDVADARTQSAPAAPARSLDEHRARRRSPAWLAAAAAAVVIAGGATLLARAGGDDDTGVTLAATEAAPGASARATVSATPAGLKILLDVDGLPGAPDDTYYEAWVSDGATRVSAGTFHLRRGDNEIELWAGVATPAFNRLSITLEPLDDDAGSSGNILLTGEFTLDG